MHFAIAHDVLAEPIAPLVEEGPRRRPPARRQDARPRPQDPRQPSGRPRHAAGVKTGGKRAALGSINPNSVLKSRAPPGTQGPTKLGALQEAAGQLEAKAEASLNFDAGATENEEYPPIEKLPPTGPLAGPLALDDSGFDHDAMMQGLGRPFATAYDHQPSKGERLLAKKPVFDEALPSSSSAALPFEDEEAATHEEAVARLAEQLDSLEALAHQSDQLQVSESMAQLIPPSDLDDLGPEMEVNLDALAPFASDIEEEDEEDEAPLNLR